MYRLLRNTHLFLGLLALLFVLMYGLSAVQMAHNGWFSMKPSITESREAIPPEVAKDPRAIAAHLRRAGMRGELRDVETTETGSKWEISRPGTVYQVGYTNATGEAKIRTNTLGFMAMLNRIHHIGGVWNNYWLIDAWAAFVGLVSAALMVLGATGIYLWFKIHRERVIGVVLLAINLGICVTLLALIRTA